MPDTEAGPVIEAQKALIRAIEKRTWAAAAGPVVPGGAEVNAAIRAFRDAIEREAAARALAEVRERVDRLPSHTGVTHGKPPGGDLLTRAAVLDAIEEASRG